MPPARYPITTTAMFARRAALVPVPIGDRHCFTQRFSPTGFILNASEPTNLTQSFCPRIQVKTYPSNSILSGNWRFPPRRIWFASGANITFLSFLVRDKFSTSEVGKAMTKSGLVSMLVVVVQLAVGVMAEAQQPAKIPWIGYLTGAGSRSFAGIYPRAVRSRLCRGQERWLCLSDGGG